MLRNRLLAATAALALASAQVTPGFALSGPQVRQQNATPVPNPDGYSAQQLLGLPAPPLGAGTTVGGDIAAGQSFVAAAIANLKTYILSLLQANYTLQVPSAAALRTTVVFTGVVAHRGGFYAAGDGGGGDYAGNTSACPNGDDGASCENAPGGSWRLDSAIQRVTPFLFGALGTGTGVSGVGADDTTALQNWLIYGSITHAKLTLPALPGSREWRTTAPLGVNGAMIDGEYCTTPNDTTQFAPWSGSVFFFDHAGRGLVFDTGQNILQNVCTFRAQPYPAQNKADGTASGNFTPGSFDFDIYADADIEVRSVMLADPTNGMYCHTGRCWINGLKGHPLTEGVKTYGLLDTAKWHDIHFWPYSAGSIVSVNNWKFSNLIAFDFYRMDNAQLDAVSSIIQKTCFKFSANNVPSTNPQSVFNGTANKIRVNGADCDGVGNGAGVLVDPSVIASLPLTAVFSNFTTQSANAPNAAIYGSVGIDVEGSGSTLLFPGNAQMSFEACNAVAVNGTGNDVRLPDAFVQNWGMQNSACPAFSVAAGNHVSYGPNWPHYDFSLTNARTYYGGSAYAIASGGKLSFPLGTGTLHAIDVTDNSMVDVLQIGGMQTLTQSGPASANFVNAGGSTDAGCLSNTPSGKVGLCYSTDSATYAAFNNTGHAVTLVYQDQRAWPTN